LRSLNRTSLVRREARVPVSMLMPATLTGTGATTDKHTPQR